MLSRSSIDRSDEGSTRTRQLLHRMEKAMPYLLVACGLAYYMNLVTDGSNHEEEEDAFHRALSIAGMGDAPHKAFLPLNERDITSICLVTIALIIAAGGGIGGGGILVPLYILVLGFRPKRAIALSTCTILGGAIANTAFALSQRHPLADRPLIDWNLVLMMEPMTIIGAVLGAMINKLSPPLVISILLVIVLGLMSRRTLKKGIEQFQREGGLARLRKGVRQDSIAFGRSLSARMSSISLTSRTSAMVEEGEVKEEEGEEEEEEDEDEPSLPFPLPRKTDSMLSVVVDATEDEIKKTSLHRHSSSWVSAASPIALATKISNISFKREKTSSQLKEEQEAKTDKSDGARVINGDAEGGLQNQRAYGSFADDGKEEEEGGRQQAILEREKRTPLWKPALVTLCFLGTATLEIIKGQGYAGPVCTWSWWLTAFAGIPWMLLWAVLIREYVIWDTAEKVEAGHSFLPGDVMWTTHNTIKFPLVCVLAGLCAGMFGIGGGIIQGPLLLEIGVLPPVAAMCNAIMIFYTSCASAIVYYTFGTIPVDYAIFFFCWGFMCTAQAMVNHMLKKYKMASFIVLSIGAIIALSTFMMFYQSISNFIQDPKTAFHVKPFCHRTSG